MPPSTDHLLLTPSHPAFPEPLHHIPNPPKQLYARGNIDLLKTPCFALVGTRANTPSGKRNAIHFTRGLVSYGLTTVSGLAFGIDAIVHEATLDHGGKTIAVLGCGIDRIYPSYHENLAHRILQEGGLILSEYPPDTITFPSNFALRNRIISGISLGVLIIEAPEGSGALITARHAFDQNRDVFALPGSLDNENMEGNNKLIASDMARLVRTPEEIMGHLSEQPHLVRQLKNLDHNGHDVNRPTPLFSTQAQATIWQTLTQKPLTAEAILDKTNLSVVDVSVALSFLELNGLVRDLGLGRYVRSY